jgi:uncharacterized SAM-binding protein YcdF (DUF218 family)
LFVFKKIVSCFLVPLPLIILILLVGIFLLWFTRKQKMGKIITSFGVVLIIIFGYRAFTDLLILPLERTYPKYESSSMPINYVVVLGGGSDSDNQLPISSQLNGHSLTRLVEGIRIYRESPGSALILSGYGGNDKKSNAEVMADVAISLGVPKDDIIQETLSRDTHDEAVLIKEIVKNEPFVLVTSAVHMKRAMMLFRKQKTNPIPAPTDYLAISKNRAIIELPSSDGYMQADSAFHEYLGILWAKIRGFI